MGHEGIPQAGIDKIVGKGRPGRDPIMAFIPHFRRSFNSHSVMSPSTHLLLTELILLSLKRLMPCWSMNVTHRETLRHSWVLDGRHPTTRHQRAQSSMALRPHQSAQSSMALRPRPLLRVAYAAHVESHPSLHCNTGMEVDQKSETQADETRGPAARRRPDLIGSTTTLPNELTIPSQAS